MSGAQPLFFGLDLSTQQLKGIVISQNTVLVHESSVHFEKDLPAHGTTNGALHGPDEGVVTSPVKMWVEALDLLMQRMSDGGVDFSKVQAISGAGQQHGSVHWSQDAEELLSTLDPERSLSDQLCPKAFSVENAPIWQDSSTTKECRALEDLVGGPQALADITGSRAYERFTGSQIAKLRRTRPDVYESTSRISLVSSFIASLFLGRIAEIELSDASGMNLTDVFTGKWQDLLLEACGGSDLRGKLGPEPVPGGMVLGTISDWWIKRWGFSPDCLIAPFTGDNPATVVALSAPGDALLSFGTSTTLLLSVPPTDIFPRRFITSHLLSHPTTLNAQVAMLCYKNGALAREQIRDQYANSDWERFNELVNATPAGNQEYSGLYFPLPEIIPLNVKGRFLFLSGKPVDDFPAKNHPRAILESQLLSIRSRIEAIMPPHAPPLKRMLIAGGSSSNDTIRQLVADVFGMGVYVSSTKEAAGMGGALLAKYSWWKKLHGGTFEEMTGNEASGLTQVAKPREDVSKVYAGLVERYRSCEDQVVKVCGTV